MRRAGSPGQCSRTPRTISQIIRAGTTESVAIPLEGRHTSLSAVDARRLTTSADKRAPPAPELEGRARSFTAGQSEIGCVNPDLRRSVPQPAAVPAAARPRLDQEPRAGRDVP